MTDQGKTIPTEGENAAADLSSWERKWKVVKKLSAGGQGDAYVVVRVGTTKPEYFMKVLRENRSERRNRMRREIACYSTLNHPSIPRLIDSNVAEFDNEAVVPYLVTELVTGTPLGNYVQKHGIFPASQAVQITCKLLEAVQHAHSQETVHRDIKPDNIILRGESIDEAVLVDFGMSFYEDERDLTLPAQEVGNRFLRLPEFHAGSSDQRDPRSDVTFCAGILFHLLTGITPRLLLNEKGLPPHQTEAGRNALRKHTDIDIHALLDVFDRAFDPTVHARWPTASGLAKALKRIRIGPQPIPENRSPEEILALIKQQMESHGEERIRLRSKLLEKGRSVFQDARNDLRDELSGFGTTDGNNVVKTQEGKSSGLMASVKAPTIPSNTRRIISSSCMGKKSSSLSPTTLFSEVRKKLWSRKGRTLLRKLGF
jgi:serine/threonine protein kinase